MIPPKRKFEYEKVALGPEIVVGIISNVEYEASHDFKYKGESRPGPGVRLVFKLDGYKHEHKTRWMTFSYGEKTNLYTKYLIKLVEGAKPDMLFDLDQLKGMKVKTIWAEENDYQHIESIFPASKKVIPTATPVEDKEEDVPDSDEPPLIEEAPF